MKLSEEFPEFREGLMEVIFNDRPYLVSDDSKKFAYQIPLANFKKGFDFYELNRARDGRVYFTIVTMVGFRTICETNSEYISSDLDPDSWRTVIINTIMSHFELEEYVALKRGYVKSRKSTNHKGTGCLLSWIFLSLSVLWLITK